MYDLPFRRGYKPQSTQVNFEIVANSSRNPSVYTIKDPQEKNVRGEFYQRVDQSQLTRQSFFLELVLNATAQLVPDNTLSSFTNFLPKQLKLEGQWEAATTELSYPSTMNVTKMSQWANSRLSDRKSIKNDRFSLSGNWFHRSGHKLYDSRKTQSLRKLCGKTNSEQTDEYW